MIAVDGRELAVRPITLADVDRLARLFTRLSPETVHFRFFSPIPCIPRAALIRLAAVAHVRRHALVALDGDEIVAVARYDAKPGADEAEIAVTVEDAWQHHGVGMQLSRQLAQLAADRGYQRFVAVMLPDNRAALGLIRKLSPKAIVRWGRGEYEATMPLVAAAV